MKTATTFKYFDNPNPPTTLTQPTAHSLNHQPPTTNHQSPTHHTPTYQHAPNTHSHTQTHTCTCITQHRTCTRVCMQAQRTTREGGGAAMRAGHGAAEAPGAGGQGHNPQSCHRQHPLNHPTLEAQSLARQALRPPSTVPARPRGAYLEPL